MDINKTNNKLKKAINNLAFYRTIIFKNHELKLICLIREEDMSPFQATWWKGKESYLVAVDEEGFMYLRHSGGYIFRVKHTAQQKEIIANSVTNFIAMIQ